MRKGDWALGVCRRWTALDHTIIGASRCKASDGGGLSEFFEMARSAGEMRVEDEYFAQFRADKEAQLGHSFPSESGGPGCAGTFYWNCLHVSSLSDS